MVRKIIAIVVSLITLWAIKETVVIFTSSDADIVARRDQLKLASLSITVPLLVASLLLWRPKSKQENDRPN